MGGKLTSPTGEYLKHTTFSDLHNHPGMAGHLEKKTDKVREREKGMYELFYRQKIVPLGTVELLKRLESICKDALEIIENVRSQRGFEKDGGLREYIHVIMKETEDELGAYNESVTAAFKPKIEPGSRNDGATKVEEIEREIKRLKDVNMQLTGENERLRKEGVFLKEENENIREEIKKLQDQVKSLSSRLSKLASHKLSENNPAIADLGDYNRPTKLGEQYKELYDNEWTDAFEALENNAKKGTEAIDILLKTLQNVFDFCSRKAELFLKETDKTIKNLFENEEENEKVRNTMYAKDKPVPSGEISMRDMQLYMKWEKPDSSRHGSASKTAQRLSESQNEKMANIISSLRKDIGFSILPLVRRAYLSPGRWTVSCIPELEPYIKKCIQICWMMVVQRPPMCLISDQSQGTKNQTELWKPYTQSGTEIDYVVWPPLLLHADGPLVVNGVAQYKKVK